MYTCDDYDEAVVKKYTKFVGEKEVKRLTKLFKPEKFVGNWKQVLCSPSTRLFGSGPKFSSVEATYKLKKNGLVSVTNDAYDGEFNRVSISGVSRARKDEVPTCRTVEFNLRKNEGDYWILYATPSFETIIVVAPIILKIFNCPLVITNNFGFYVLTKDRKKFWKTEEQTHVVGTLKKYGFTQLWNGPIATGETYDL